MCDVYLKQRLENGIMKPHVLSQPQSLSTLCHSNSNIFSIALHLFSNWLCLCYKEKHFKIWIKKKHWTKPMAYSKLWNNGVYILVIMLLPEQYGVIMWYQYSRGKFNYVHTSSQYTWPSYDKCWIGRISVYNVPHSFRPPFCLLIAVCHETKF